MIKLTRKEKKGDRSRSRISMPRESAVPMYQDGMVVIRVLHQASAKRLERLGYVRVPDVATKPAPPVQATKPVAPVQAVKPVPPVPTPVPPTDLGLADMDMRALKKMAKDRKLKGRSKLDRDGLIAALS